MDGKIKILASDYDDTLKFNNGISQADLDAIAKFRSMGNKFGIVTGRGSDSISEIRKLPLDFIICATGSVIIDANGEVLYQNRCRFGEFIKMLLDYARSLDCWYFKYSLDYEGFDVEPILDCIEGKDFEQCYTRFATEDKARRFADYVNENFSDTVVAYANGISVDIPAAGRSKTAGIVEYAKRFENSVIYTIGDNDNDIDMIRSFNGIAVSNAKQCIKELAMHQADRIADAIEFIINN